jgi:hypothetical protein
MPATTTSINAPATALWASAFIIVAIIIMQAGRLPGNPAHASVVADRGDYTLMTADSGKGGDIEPDEILCVIDSRDRVMLVYEIENARQGGLVLRERLSLDELFMRARGR